MLLLSPTISLIVQWKIYQKIEHWIYGYSTVGHPFSQHFYCYYYLRNKDQYIKGGMAGESWVNVSLQLFLFGGFSIKLMATESLELFSYLCEHSFILDGETC